jgi:predicted dehydrogenase
MNFAVIGCGMLAQGQHLPNISASEHMGLHTCCDLSADTLERCREKFQPKNTTSDFREAVRDPEVEAICLATTEALRLPVIEAAAEVGKPLFTEKPLAATLKEAVAIQRTVHGSGIPFCIGHNRRCSPAMVDAHRLFRQHMENPKVSPWRWDREGDNRPARPEEGTPAAWVRVNDDYASWKAWVYEGEKYGHGPILWEMTHHVDLCNWFLQSEPVEVMAMETGLYLHSFTIRYASGALATITSSANGSFGYSKELHEFSGEAGFVAVHHMVEVITAGMEGAPRRTVYPVTDDAYPGVGREGGFNGWLAKRDAGCSDAVESGDHSRVLRCEPDKGHAHMLEAFVQEIRGERGPVCGVDDAVLATRVCLAAIASARERRMVRLEEIRPD